MKNLTYSILFGLGLSALISCKTSPPQQIENPKYYQLEIKKDEYYTSKDSIPKSSMNWLKKDKNCKAIFSSDEVNYCFDYTGRPDYLVLISDQSTEENLGSITNIKKYQSVLNLPTGEEFTMKPIRGVLTVLYNDFPTARVLREKRKYNLEIDAAYYEDELLKAAILYKNAEYMKMSNSGSGDDFLLFMLLLGAL